MMVDTEDWRRSLRRGVAWVLIAKLGALALLWALFFSAPQPAPRAGFDATIVQDTGREKTP
jgi:hypothetical protein